MNKYNFRVSVNQFGQQVEEDFIDQDEIFLIQEFEKILESLKHETKDNYSMLELGSNQCFYSLMFKSVLGKEKTTNFMIEPLLEALYRGMNEFHINNYQGYFLHRSIGNKNLGFGGAHDLNSESVTVDQFMSETKISDLDVLHCDIDGSEVLMLNGAETTLKEKKIKYLIILTHSWSANHPHAKQEIIKEFNLEGLHNNCLEILNSYGYDVIYQNEEPVVGGDGLIIAKRK